MMERTKDEPSETLILAGGGAVQFNIFKQKMPTAGNKGSALFSLKIWCTFFRFFSHFMLKMIAYQVIKYGIFLRNMVTKHP